MTKRFALEGIRVADFGWAYAGPYLTKLLADMGAEVIKIESRTRPDIVRVTGPFLENKPGINRSGFFNELNRNKRSITLDLTKPKGVALAKEIIKFSDLVIENYAPRVMEKFGLHYQSLKEIKPDIIMCSLSGFGATGPERDFISFGSGQVPLSGLGYLTGYQDRPPERTPMAYPDPTSGLWGACMVLAALYYRKRTGKGQYIDLSELEVAVNTIGGAIIEYTLNQRVPERMGNHHPWLVPHGFYPCQGDDKWIAIAISSEEEWHNLCGAMGYPAWCQEERFSLPLNRWKNQDELDRLIGDWTKQYSHYQLTKILQGRGIPATPVLNAEELVQDPHLKQRGLFVQIDHPEGGPRFLTGLPMKLSESKSEIRRPAPGIGEDTEYVFGHLLKLPQVEIERLISEKIIY